MAKFSDSKKAQNNNQVIKAKRPFKYVLKNLIPYINLVITIGIIVYLYYTKN